MSDHPLAGKPRSEGKSTLLWTRLKNDEADRLAELRERVQAQIGRELTQAEFLRGVLRYWMRAGKLRIYRTDP